MNLTDVAKGWSHRKMLRKMIGALGSQSATWVVSLPPVDGVDGVTKFQLNVSF